MTVRLLNPVEILFYIIWFNSLLWTISLIRLFYLSIVSHLNKENYICQRFVVGQEYTVQILNCKKRALLNNTAVEGS